jgi:hypothetical protein
MSGGSSAGVGAALAAGLTSLDVLLIPDARVGPHLPAHALPRRWLPVVVLGRISTLSIVLPKALVDTIHVLRCWRCEADGVWPREANRSTIIPPVAEDERRRSGSSDFLERRSYEPRLALRRVQSAVLALVIIIAVGIFGYVVFEGWSFVISR